MDVGPDILAALFGVSLIAGFVDSIAGGGGLLTVPALLWAGLPPAAAIATNKLQACFGSFSASVKFVRGGEVDPRGMTGMIACALIGGLAGAAVLQVVDASVLKDAIPFLLVGIALYLLLSPKAGDVDAHRRLGEGAFALLVCTGIGFYDGIFGPGTGTFFTLAFVALAGFNLRKATAHAKVLNFASNIASLLGFLAGGSIVWSIGLVMAVGAYAGAQMGAHMVIRNGARIVRPMLVAASLAITAKLVWSDPDHPMRHAVAWVVGLFG